MVKVSVIIPAYNAAETLQRAVQSVLTQTMEDLEVLVINNGSTDQTATIIERLASSDSRVRFLYSDKGRSRARNKGLAEAEGDFIQFLDADDELSASKLDKAVSYLKSNTHKAAYVTAAVYKNDRTGQESVREIPIESAKPLLKANYFPISSPLVRRQILKSKFREDLEFNEDWLFWAENLYGADIEVSHSVGSVIHITSQNTMTQFDRMQMYECYVRGILKEEFSAKGPNYWLRDLRYALNYLLSRPESNERPLSLSKSMGWPLRAGRMLLATPVVSTWIVKKRAAVKSHSQYGN
ncbi:MULTISPECIES: glycosyltransferase family 2 protein [Lacticaseibacillus]|uniref:glycosyltransferase family 2 protein n=1 Tax=Lacticaseibacillus TaxID=2759736 RepID=UPI00063DC4D7|nr:MULTISPECIES: glycosyltransferase family 2 protein [Lacticaseibacillus]KLI75223.1 glycosyl transferase [Lacticaseibacillus casei]